MTEATIFTFNENSWKHTLFLDPSSYKTVEEWPYTCNPSEFVKQAINKSVIVLHPNIHGVLEQFMKRNHRNGFSVAAHVKKRITGSSNRNLMTHDQLLTMADKSYDRSGFWLLSCESKNRWDYYFKKIAAEMYSNASDMRHGVHQYVKIEARWNRPENNGIIMVSNSFFPSLSLIQESGERIRALINITDVREGQVSICLSYKPQFYIASDFDLRYSHDFETNIFSFDLTSDPGPESPLQFSDGVLAWLNKNVRGVSTA